MTAKVTGEEMDWRIKIGLDINKPLAPDEVVDWSNCPLAQKYPYGVYPGNGKANNGNKDLL